MEENQNLEENTYSQEEVDRITQESIESVLKEVQYDESKVQGWINAICEKVTQQLIELGKPYKYIVHCMIMQRNGAGAFVTTSQWWDTVADGQIIISWPKDKQAKQEQQKNTLHCICSVFAVSMI
ncbi:unnamed protein product [Paramecium primaurelia]|uniref:Dynein light chain n=5 Tax=Paramecium TaxID=5884 RepID=A0DUH6_PARTE|nr:uncharacterized protein GSPATT00020365001 [Paramecium tetraurelia]CAD8071916.1 unnamed protein product [Paramecium primaurelia]CAD8099734.1 unnamed protein product [Paramecium sonneborni]CAD8169053.1 unnamed protein product [Paramecium pentaurelia]CAD8183508.1 unnamed protein product [Paramecium octaurelia]CAD8080213.1 unnamed protein product [Paramecium primaurelia]|eukprot:XP_001454090.1 hypothetical protein (macronuclear) [Paramecium tetraurelia strain d4-2]